MGGALRVGSRNAAFQQWEALLSNRKKRNQAAEFLVQGVRPLNMAARNGWEIRALLYNPQARRSPWATQLIDQAQARHVHLSAELLQELGEKDAGPPELIGVVGIPPDDLDRIAVSGDLLVTVFDRPSSPGNLGTLIRSADALGGSGVVVTGHATDPYDPRCVRASTGSLFGVPVVRVPSHQPVLDWIASHRAAGVLTVLLGTDEVGDAVISEVDLTGPTVVLVGNETSGLTAAWKEACDLMVKIPMVGTASSLNAATAGTVALYEARRQRAGGRRG